MLIHNTLMNPKNVSIIDKNNLKVNTSILHSLRKVDDRTISYEKAKTNLWGMTRNYLSTHF